MAKKPVEQPSAPDTDHLNALIPRDLKRRMMIARANTGRPMTALLVEWIEKGLADVERQAGKGK